MPGHVFYLVREAQALLLLQHPDDRKGNSHQGGLGVFGQRQNLKRTVEHDLGELLAERSIDLIKQRPGGPVSPGQLGPHAHRLAALSREHERNSSHWPNQIAPLAGALSSWTPMPSYRASSQYSPPIEPAVPQGTANKAHTRGTHRGHTPGAHTGSTHRATHPPARTPHRAGDRVGTLASPSGRCLCACPLEAIAYNNRHHPLRLEAEREAGSHHRRDGRAMPGSQCLRSFGSFGPFRALNCSGPKRGFAPERTATEGKANLCRSTSTCFWRARISARRRWKH